MRAKAGALCQVTKAFQHNNSYQSLPKPVGLYGSLYGCSGMCRCLFKGCGGWEGVRGNRGGGRYCQKCWSWCCYVPLTLTFSSRSVTCCLHNSSRAPRERKPGRLHLHIHVVSKLSSHSCQSISVTCIRRLLIFVK